MRGHYTHGMSNTRLYRCYRDMINRCNGKKLRDKANYFDRGITYCKEWNTFEGFRDWALSHGYRDDLTLDRIDVNGDYSPDNCRWITRKEQNNNTRSNHYITFKGQTMTVAQWAEKLGINKNTLYNRLDNLKWSVEKALNEPVRRGGNRRAIRNT